MTMSEQDLVRRAAQSDLEAFEQLVRAYQERILFTAVRILGNREDARDAAQEVFVRLYRFLPRFDQRRRFETWLYKIVVNVSYDIAKKTRHARGEVSLDDLPPHEWPQTRLENAADDTQEKVFAMTERLTHTQRSVFVLREVEGFSCREIAEIMECTSGTVRSHLHHARVKLRDLIERHYPELVEGRRHEMS
jgi:RNA polymerase sigma-70 factor (ECF subfamily)